MAKKRTRKKATGRKKKAAAAPRGEIFAPNDDRCAVVSTDDVRSKMRTVLRGRHTSTDTAMDQLDLLEAVIGLYRPPLSVFCQGMAAVHFETVLDQSDSFQVTARGRVFYTGS